MSSLVSVVIVTYNKEDTLASAIESVLRQTFQDFEILVVDDGSTDGTSQIVGSFGSKVRYLPKQNGGTGSARNLGIREARSPFVAFLDGDDLWLPNKLELQMAAFEREPEILAVQCGAYCVNPCLEVLEERTCTPIRDTLLDFLLFNNLPAFASAVVVRRNTLLALGGFGEDLVILSDWDMACRLARAGTLRSVSELLVLYRHYPSNQSRSVDIHIESGEKSLRRFFKDPTLDRSIRRRESLVWARFYAMLSGGYLRNGDYPKAFSWTRKALATSWRVAPYVLGMPVRWMKRKTLPPVERSFAKDFSYAV